MTVCIYKRSILGANTEINNTKYIDKKKKMNDIFVSFHFVCLCVKLMREKCEIQAFPLEHKRNAIQLISPYTNRLHFVIYIS